MKILRTLFLICLVVFSIGVQAQSYSSFSVRLKNGQNYTFNYKEVESIDFGVPTLITAVKLDKKELNLLTNDSVQLNVAISPEFADNKSLDWISSNPDIATVDDNGYIRTYNPGNCEIICASNDGSEVSDTCHLSVAEKPLRNVTILTDSVSIGLGKTFQIRHSFTPSDAYCKELLWTSSNDTIVTVTDEGIITGINLGEASVICTSKRNTEISDTIVVNVVEVPPTLVSSISVTPKQLELTYNTTLELNVTVLPEDADNIGVSWRSSDENIASVENGVVMTKEKSGSCYVICQAKDASAIQDTCLITVKQFLEPTIILAEQKKQVVMGYPEKLEIKTLYPDSLSVDWYSSNTNIATVSNGTVKGVSDGFCDIIVTAADGEDIVAQDTCHITVVSINLMLDNCSLTVPVSSNKNLVATTFPEDMKIQTIWESSDTTVVKVEDGVVTAIAPGVCKITAKCVPGNVERYCRIIVPEEHEYIDLSLPSGTLWAKTNIGAQKEYQAGSFFAWGETVPYGEEDFSNVFNYNVKNSYTRGTVSWQTYKFGGDANNLTKYCKSDGRTILEPNDDAATVNWGDEWSMPTFSQFDELFSECYVVWEGGNEFNNNKPGYRFFKPKKDSDKGTIVSSAGNYSATTDENIYLPYTGFRYADSIYMWETQCYYWSSDLYPDNAKNACRLYIIEGERPVIPYELRYEGMAIRPVRSN